MPSPSWSEQSNKQRESHITGFRTVLSSVASAFAEHDHMEWVSTWHVDEAYRALSKCGLSRRPWVPDFCVSLGALLVGLSLSMPTFLGRILPDKSQWEGTIWVQVCVFAGFLVAGSLVWLGGWQSRLKLPERTRSKTRWKTCWPFLQCPKADENSRPCRPIVGKKHLPIHLPFPFP